jgi:GNAT superfamily N-acetyltransferase
MGISIRNAAITDAAIIAGNNSLMAEETEGRTLDPEIIGLGVAALLADPGKGRYWVDEADGQIIGQLMVTYEWSDWRNGTLWWIQSVYVAPDFRRQGVFSALYHHVESLAATQPDVCGLRLYVEDNNHRAQRTYEALGMVEPGYVVMESMFHERDND